MKAALILLSLFFLMVTFRARAEHSVELEKRIHTLLESKDHFVSLIDTRSLAISEYLSFGIYRESCNKLGEVLEKAKTDNKTAPGAPRQLLRHFKSCSQGVDGLAFLYSQQTTH